jgi:hypothetical protein
VGWPGSTHVPGGVQGRVSGPPTASGPAASGESSTDAVPDVVSSTIVPLRFDEHLSPGGGPQRFSASMSAVTR